MNEHDLERQFRSVTEGSQPNAAPSLRFLHELPNTQPAVAFALVAGLVASNLLLTIRGHDIAATPTGGMGAATANPTFVAGGFTWTGNLGPDVLVPQVAVAGGPDGYLGVGLSADGTSVLLTSNEALHWSVKPTSGIDPRKVDLKSIARGGNGFVGVGEPSSPGTQPPPPAPRRSLASSTPPTGACARRPAAAGVAGLQTWAMAVALVALLGATVVSPRGGVGAGRGGNAPLPGIGAAVAGSYSIVKM